jgi:hypothetical protein
MVGTAQRFRPSGVGFVKVPGAQAPVKEKIFLHGEAFYKAKSSDWGLQGPPMPMAF